jgi:hypothetical protein
MFVLFSIRADFVEIVRDLHVRADSFEKTKSKVGINHFLLSLYLFRYPGPLICEYYLLPPTLPYPSPTLPLPSPTTTTTTTNNIEKKQRQQFPCPCPHKLCCFLDFLFSTHTLYCIHLILCTPTRLPTRIHSYTPTHRRRTARCV